VRNRTATATRIASVNYSIAPSADGHGLWLLRRKDAQHCTLREVALDGRQLRGPRAAPCAGIASAGSAGLVFRTFKPRRDTLVDPLTRRPLLHASSIVAVSGGVVLTTNASHGNTAPLVVTELGMSKRVQLSWPSELTWSVTARVQPSGKAMAIELADPAYPGPAQALDVWLLDPSTSRLTEVPDMPAEVSLKFSDEQWTADGRLVFLGVTGDHNFVGVWRPGDDHIAVREVQLPHRTSGSDSFVAWN
jgi:hypothetical protein